jgi:hypothetical protein
MAPPVTTTTTAPAQNGKLVAVQGGTPGLYGGTQDIATCDPGKMIDFLSSQPQKAAAWASAVGITTAEIPSYIQSLTPVVLTRDTRVTNHGFVNGTANPFQAVLQAGTAVLVDRYGVPRAKCACGNPLGPPVLSTAPPSYVGPSWPSFSPTTITVVVVNTTIVNNFVLVSQSDGTPFVRPSGSDGSDDQTLSMATICQLIPDYPSCTGTSGSTTTTTTTTQPAKNQPALAVQILTEAIAVCGQQQDVSVSDLSYAATATGTANTYSVVVSEQGSGQYGTWTVNVATGTISAIDANAIAVGEVCSNLS